MKNKKIIFGIIVLFAITGICSIQNVSADSWDDVKIPPLSYWTCGFEVDYRDELEIYVSSSGAISIYVMNEEQIDNFEDSGGLNWYYLKRWKDITYLENVYTIPADGVYYVLVYNKNLFYTRTVNIRITIDYYFVPSSDNILENMFFFVIILIVAIGVVIIVIITFKRPKEKIPKEVIIVQEREILKGMSYCHECGAKVSDKERIFCSNCGSKIIKLI